MRARGAGWRPCSSCTVRLSAPGRHPLVVRLDGVAQGGEDAVHPLARERRDLEHGRRAQEGQPVAHPGQDVVALVGRHQVPLVEGHDGRAPRHADALGQALVLMRRARPWRR